MRNNRINFFESPDPNHFNINLLEESRFQNHEDHEIHEERLFYTPVRLNRQVLTTPSPQIDPYLMSSHPKSRPSYDIFADHSMEIPNQQQLQSQNRTIKEKLEYSDDEDLLNHLTPLKPQKNDNHHQQPTTIKKSVATPMTPLSQSRSSERGLKRLAAEAFRFVTTQKRTTYKQVAKKLINDLGGDDDIDPSVHQHLLKKRGEMNIKRRVYDALNVLIALGLLKRNGNKIIGKRLDLEYPPGNKMVQKEKQRKTFFMIRFKEQQMERELQVMKTQIEKRTQMIEAKKKHQQSVKLKLEKLRGLITKNTKDTIKETNKEKIAFPLIMICQKGAIQEQQSAKVEQKEQMIDEGQERVEESRIMMWQESTSHVYCHFNPERLEVMGELDLVSNWKGEEKKNRARGQRIKRKIQ